MSLPVGTFATHIVKRVQTSQVRASWTSGPSLVKATSSRGPSYRVSKLVPQEPHLLVPSASAPRAACSAALFSLALCHTLGSLLL